MTANSWTTQAAYDKWCRLNNFESKLLKVVQEHKDAALAADRAKQQSLDPHLTKELPREKACGVVVPTGKATHAYIIKLFKKNLTHLQDHINVGDLQISIRPSWIYLQNNKTSLVFLTCDAWQASNQDAYFGVTGHWNKGVSPNNWKNHSAFFGFTQMNTAHDGVRLGRALFKIIK